MKTRQSPNEAVELGIIPPETDPFLTARLTRGVMGATALREASAPIDVQMNQAKIALRSAELNRGKYWDERQKQIESVYPEIAAAINDGELVSPSEILDVYLAYKRELGIGTLTNAKDGHLPELVNQLQPGVAVALLPTAIEAGWDDMRTGAGVLEHAPQFSLGKYGRSGKRHELALHVTIRQGDSLASAVTFEYESIAVGTEAIVGVYAQRVDEYIKAAQQRVAIDQEYAGDQLLLDIPRPEIERLVYVEGLMSNSLSYLPDVANDPRVQSAHQKFHDEIAG